ncbi:MAG: MOSC domain-containing protein [Actinomycetota bacterium]
MITIRRVSVGTPRPIGNELVSAIGKRPVVAGPIRLSEINLDGDDQADRTVHGGPDKAVYAHPFEHLEAWAADLGQPGLPSTDAAPFGENLSTIGVTEETVSIGDVWRWGDARLQVCQPRTPCRKLTVHRGDAGVGPLMRSTGRTGWYLRVLDPGTVAIEGTIDVDPHPAGITVSAANAAMEDRRLENRALVERVVALGDVLAAEWRDPLVERLAAR